MNVINMSTIVLSIGGSILTPEGSEIEYVNSLAALLKRLTVDNKIYIVVGGGPLARKYINLGRSLGGTEIALDEIGIAATRLNARLLITALEEFAYPVPAETFTEAKIQAQTYPLIIMGGTHPGHTTDAVAIMLGEYVSADKFINVTSVDGVYTADPAIDPSATKIDKLTPDRLIEITQQSASKAGPHIVIDPLAARIIKRSGILTFVLDGHDLTALENAIIGKQFNGSIIEEE
jgi:uridylate kinase